MGIESRVGCRFWHRSTTGINGKAMVLTLFDETWDLVLPVAKTSRSNQLYRSVLSPKQAP
ncbi:MAG: hypothetical protein F6K56_02735 [Moorea sp. SIO3G5]|nr:hypothetical protein [Moorena sp. SIO3G5]